MGGVLDNHYNHRLRDHEGQRAYYDFPPYSAAYSAVQKLLSEGSNIQGLQRPRLDLSPDEPATGSRSLRTTLNCLGAQSVATGEVQHNADIGVANRIRIKHISISI